MKKIDTSKLSTDECWGVQINGLKHCCNCKWTGISACEGQNIVKTGYNSKGYYVGENGLGESEDSSKSEVISPKSQVASHKSQVEKV